MELLLNIQVYFASALPKTGSGKIQRRVIADAFYKPDEEMPKPKL